MEAAEPPACILYRVVTDYTPSAEYEARGCMVLRRGDMLVVQSPVQLQDGTEQQPKGDESIEILLLAVTYNVKPRQVIEAGLVLHIHNTNPYTHNFISP